jgi:hypothetical protein
VTPRGLCDRQGRTIEETPAMAEHKHGEMDIEVQEKTFNGFVRWVVNVTIICILVLIFLAIFNS